MAASVSNRVRQAEHRRLFESYEFHAGAATEGRPYSTCDGTFINSRLLSSRGRGLLLRRIGDSDKVALHP